MGVQVLTEAARKMIADNATGQANANSLDTAKVRLFTTPISPTAATVLADITPATFDGYADSAVVAWDDTLIGPASMASVEGDTKEFVCTGNTVSETIYGAALCCHAGGGAGAIDLLLTVETFDTPIPISRAGQGVRYTPHFEYP